MLNILFSSYSRYCSFGFGCILSNLHDSNMKLHYLYMYVCYWQILFQCILRWRHYSKVSFKVFLIFYVDYAFFMSLSRCVCEDNSVCHSIGFRKKKTRELRVFIMIIITNGRQALDWLPTIFHKLSGVILFAVFMWCWNKNLLQSTNLQILNLSVCILCS